MIKRIKTLMDRYIDYKAACMAAVLLGAIVFSINYKHGGAPATTAAMKQMAYTFFVAGLITRNNARLAVRGENTARSLGFAVSVSSMLAVGLTFGVHSLRGTPEPLLSTLPTLCLAPPGFFALGLRERRNAAIDE